MPVMVRTRSCWLTGPGYPRCGPPDSGVCWVARIAGTMRKLRPTASPAPAGERHPLRVSSPYRSGGTGLDGGRGDYLLAAFLSGWRACIAVGCRFLLRRVTRYTITAGDCLGTISGSAGGYPVTIALRDGPGFHHAGQGPVRLRAGVLPYVLWAASSGVYGAGTPTAIGQL